MVKVVHFGTPGQSSGPQTREELRKSKFSKAVSYKKLDLVKLSRYLHELKPLTNGRLHLPAWNL